MLFNLIGFLASQARMYGQIVSGEKVKGNPYVIKRKTPIAKRLGRQGVARMIDLALDAEFSIKTGARRYEEVMDILIAGPLICSNRNSRPAAIDFHVINSLK